MPTSSDSFATKTSGVAPIEPPVLSDGVVRLRALSEADLHAVVEQCRDSEVIRFTTIPLEYGPPQAQEFLASVRADWSDRSGTTARTWAIDVARPRSGQPSGSSVSGAWQFAGTTAYRPDGPGTANVGYLVHPAARGAGVASRALRLLVDHLFADETQQVLHWRAITGNWASRRVAWSCGFRFEGLQRASIDDRGSSVDAWVASLHRDEPRRPVQAWWRTPRLDGDGVVLRPWRDDDGDRLPAVRDEVAQRFLGEIVPTSGSFTAWWSEVQEFQAAGDQVSWCLADPVTDEVLGGMQVFRLTDPRSGHGRFGYWLIESARGRGVIARAATAALGWAFTPHSDGGPGLLAVSADAEVANTPSIRCLHRAGFRDVGVRRRAGVRPDGTVVDLLDVDLLEQDRRAGERCGVNGPAAPSPR